MTFKRIKELIDLLPATSSYFREVLNYATQVTPVNKFMCAYKDLSFGYKFIKALIKDNITLPSSVTEPYLKELYFNEKFGDCSNEDLLFALSLHHPSNKMMEDTIKACLITDSTFSDISTSLGIPEKVLECFEQLFYNIRDRKSESLFIASIVYPDTRMVELDKDYASNESFSKMIMRSAYNNGMSDALYFAGLKMSNNILNSNSAAVSASDLEAAIMSNAFFLAKNGFINQQVHGLSSAKGLLIAAKQGGAESTVGDEEGFTSIGESIWNTIQEIKGPEMQNKLDAIMEVELGKLESPKD